MRDNFQTSFEPMKLFSEAQQRIFPPSQYKRTAIHLSLETLHCKFRDNIERPKAIMRCFSANTFKSMSYNEIKQKQKQDAYTRYWNARLKKHSEKLPEKPDLVKPILTSGQVAGPV